MEKSDDIKRVKNGLFNRMKDKYKESKNYQISSNFWFIGIMIILVNMFCIIVIFIQSISHLKQGDISLLLVLISLIIIILFNIRFICFPEKSPKNIMDVEEGLKNEIDAKKMQDLTKSIDLGSSTRLKLESEKKLYLSEEDMELQIPAIPNAPKKKEKLTLETSNLSIDVLDRINLLKSPNTKVVLVNCERCRSVIPVPVPKNFVLESELPVVPISFIHRNLQNQDQHCITIHLDHDFDIRRQRISDVVLSPD